MSRANYRNLGVSQHHRHRPTEGIDMSDHVYRVTEIVGTSTEGVDAAVRAGVERASMSLHGLDWFQITEVRGHIVEGRVEHYQVGMKVGFRLDQP